MRRPIALALSLALSACRAEVSAEGVLFADPGVVDLAAARLVEGGVRLDVAVANVGTTCVGIETIEVEGDPNGHLSVGTPTLPHLVAPGEVERLEIAPVGLPIPAGLGDAVIVVSAVVGETIEGACVLPEADARPVVLRVPVVLATPAACDVDRDGALLPWCGGEDCDDDDPTVFPGAEETCNRVDDDCDGTIDGPDVPGAVDWYLDADDDLFGDAAEIARDCFAPARHVGNGDDCDDADAEVFPGAPESCDGTDQDCDGDIDEGYSRFDFHPDADGDGYGDGSVTIRACLVPEGATPNDDDCDDGDASIFPGAPEVCDGVDQDCDGAFDEDAIDAFRWWVDVDGDSFGNAAVYVQACEKPAGYAGNHLDCNDGDATIKPNAAETCDEVDEDCDGVVDDDPIDGDPWYPDVDGDGYGDESAVVVACDPVPGTIAEGGDCDDDDDDINPDANEVCDAVDQDCDGLIDQGPNVCGCPIQHFGDHAYGFCNVSLTWQFAGFACSLTGYDLVKIDDAAEDAWVAATARGINTGGWWTGYTDGAVEGTWLWADGTAGTYTNWAPGRPATGNNVSDCMTIGSTAGWVDSNCGNFDLRRFVCEAGP